MKTTYTMDDYYNEDDEQDEQDIYDYKYKDMNNRNEPYNKNYKSNIMCLIISVFILIFFSSFCLSKIDNIGEKINVNFFDSKGEPTWILLLLQFVMVFLIIKMICKY